MTRSHESELKYDIVKQLFAVQQNKNIPKIAIFPNKDLVCENVGDKVTYFMSSTRDVFNVVDR